MKFVNLGFNIVRAEQIVAVISVDASPSPRLKETSEKLNKLVDATNGCRTRTLRQRSYDPVALNPDRRLNASKEA